MYICILQTNEISHHKNLKRENTTSIPKPLTRVNNKTSELQHAVHKKQINYLPITGPRVLPPH